MVKIAPKFVYDEQTGKKTGVLLTYAAFERLVEELEDFQDYLTIKNLPKKRGKTYPLDEVIAEIMSKK